MGTQTVDKTCVRSQGQNVCTIGSVAKTTYQSCTLSTPDYRACAPAGQCSDSCGQAATTVPDGMGGQTSCPATDACVVPTHRWCSLQDDGSYKAEAIPVSQEEHPGYPWTNENPTCIDLCSKIEGLQMTTELCPAPVVVDGYWSDWSQKSDQCGYKGEQTRTCTPRYSGRLSKLIVIM
jgi:hypothetical protein